MEQESINYLMSHGYNKLYPWSVRYYKKENIYVYVIDGSWRMYMCWENNFISNNKRTRTKDYIIGSHITPETFDTAKKAFLKLAIKSVDAIVHTCEQL